MRSPSVTQRRDRRGQRTRSLAPVSALAGLAACGLGSIASGRELDLSAGEVERAVGEVFADPALRRGLEESHGGSWALQIYVYLIELYARVMRFLLELQLDSPFFFWSLFVGLVVVLVLILWHLAWTFGLAFRRPALEDAPPGEQVAARIRRSIEMRRESRELASRGMFREATRLLLLALLALLEESRTLKVALGWTNREILGRLRLRPEFTPDLRFFERTVEAVWYGGANLEGGDFRRLDTILGEITRHVQSRPSSDPRSGGSR